MFKKLILIVALGFSFLHAQNSELHKNFEYNKIILNNGSTYISKINKYGEQKLLALSYFNTDKYSLSLQATNYLFSKYPDKIDSSDYILLLQLLQLNKKEVEAENLKVVIENKFKIKNIIKSDQCRNDSTFIINIFSGSTLDGEYDLQLIDKKKGYITKISTQNHDNVNTWLALPNFEIAEVDFNDSIFKTNKTLIADSDRHYEFNAADAYGNLYITTNDIDNSRKRELNPLQIKILQVIGSEIKIKNTTLNEDLFNTAHLSISPNNKIAVFSSDRIGGYGNSDLYITNIEKQTKDTVIFGKITNLGSAINTSFRETYPIFKNDSIILFSSDGKFAFGGLDLYSYNLNSRELQLLPKPFNSEKDDINLRFYDSFYLLSSNRSETDYYNDDIYRITKKVVPPKAIVQKRVSLYVKLVDPISNTPISNQWVIIENTKHNNTNNRLYLKTDSLGSVYVPDFCYLDSVSNYSVSAEPCNYKYCNSSNFTVSNESAKILLSPASRKLGDEIGSELKLKSIRYELDKYEITENSKSELNILASFLNKYPNINIELQSHTDSRGSDAYNLKLSNNRAKAAKDYVVSVGIESNRINSIGFGETKLLNNCDNNIKCPESEHEINRRTEYVITKFNPCETILKPILSEVSDTDNDGILDALEGFNDSDNDGVPNYLDPK